MKMRVYCLEQHCATELSAMMEIYISVLSTMVATSTVRLLSHCNVASATKELNILFCLNLNVYSMWFLAIVLAITDPEFG